MDWETVVTVLGSFGLGSIITAVVSGVLESRRQDRIDERAERREKRDRAFQFYEEFSALIATRLYRMRRIYYCLRSNSTLNRETVKSEYSEVVQDWNCNLNKNLAKIEYFFSYAHEQKFEKELMPKFIELGSRFENFFKVDPQVSDLQKAWSDLDVLNAATYAFDKSMLDMISRDKFQK